ncbi:MAG: 3-hydroxyacyl-CoA dehydrogenase family protein [Nakamurella sp.]
MIEPEAPHSPERVGVVGGGRMGSGIAHAFLVRGSQVTLIEADADRIGNARESVIRSIEASVRRGAVTESAEAIVARISVGTDIAALADAQLVIEAVPEIPDLKQQVLQAISAVIGDSQLIASNTSSLSISELSQHVDAPERFLGMHFFNPVPASQLVEVVCGTRTAEATVRAVQEIVASLGKVAITVTDSPGFASSRLGILLGLEAIRMVEEGVATAEDIDAAMTLGYQHPIGPLKLTDLVGLDVRLAIANYLTGQLGNRFAPPQLLRDMVARGDLGRKTGRGFYDWPKQ